MTLNKSIVVLVFSIINSVLIAQITTRDFNHCNKYDNHLLLELYNKNAADTSDLNSLTEFINKVKKDSSARFSFYSMPLSLRYDVLPDTCKCFVSFKPLLKPLNIKRSKNRCVIELSSNSKLIINTKRLNFAKKYPEALLKIKSIDSIRGDQKRDLASDPRPYYGYNENNNRQISEFKKVSNHGNKKSIVKYDTSLFSKLLNPNFVLDINKAETMVTAYQTEDLHLTYIYIIGLYPWVKKSKHPNESIKTERVYYTKVVLEGDKIICVATIPPDLLYTYQSLYSNIYGREFPGF